MIHVYMRGRLGNQLFQYAFVRMLQFNNPEAEVCWHWNDVISQGKEEEGWKNSLVDFNTIGTLSQAIEPKLNLLQKLIYRIYWMFYPHNADIEVRNKYQLRWAPILNKCALYYLDLGFFSFKKLLKNKCDVLISGNFESSRFFYEIDNQIRKEIIPRYPVMDHNIEMMDLIRTTNSVCVSIRRGDYINNNETEKLLIICGKSYSIL